jgi:3-oxoacyl-[acyl-carrier-protein] synthase-3
MTAVNTRNVGILGTGSYVPERILSNQDLERMVETNDEWIVTRTGIRERRIAAEGETTTDLALKAARAALEASGVAPEEIGLVIVATITADRSFPSTACRLQERLGLPRAAAFDLSAACSGFIYALSAASQSIASGVCRHALVVGAERLSSITDYTDRNTCVLFGDGAGAVVLGPVEEGRGFRSFELGADGTGGDLLTLNDKGCIAMNGREVFKFAVRIMGSAAEEALSKAGLTKADIDLLVPHQANIRIIDAALERLDLPADKCMVNLHRYGNVSAASIPLALDEAVRGGRVNPGDCVVLVGFGGGLTWGASVLIW